jgi:hypothetical protein
MIGERDDDGDRGGEGGARADLNRERARVELPVLAGLRGGR